MSDPTAWSLDDDEGWALDDNGDRYGYCNHCGEEAAEFDDCCDEGEVVPYKAKP